MYCIQNADVIKTLRGIMNGNTSSYCEDFDADVRILRRAAYSRDPEDKWLWWMSRDLGTYTFFERDLFFRGSFANICWLHYSGRQERILAYAVEITGAQGRRNGKVTGNLYMMDYEESVETLKRESFDTASVELVYKNGTRWMQCKDNQIRASMIPQSDPKFGPLDYIRRHPADGDGFQWKLEEKRNERRAIFQ